MPEVVLVLPRPLRRFADGRSELRVEADDLGGAIRAACGVYPELARPLFDDGGGLRRSVRVFQNGADVPSPTALASPLAAGDRLEVVIALAGG